MNTETAILLFNSTIQPIFDYNEFYYNMLNQKIFRNYNPCKIGF